MKRLITILLIGLAFASAVGLLAPNFWGFDLFNHFRVQYVLCSIVLLAATTMLYRKMVAVALLVLLLNLGWMGLRLAETSGIDRLADGQKADIAVLASNVLSANTHYAAVREMVARENPDIVVLTEPTPEWMEQMVPLERSYPYVLKHQQSGNFGMAIYAKRPFTSAVHEMGRWGIPLAVLDFGDFLLVAAHPIPPIPKENQIENKEYLAKIAELTKASTKPMILAGDLNATLWSHSTAALIDAGFKRVNPSGMAYTWPTTFPLMAIQIDHFFATGVTSAEFQVLENVGSDHYPILMRALIRKH